MIAYAFCGSFCTHAAALSALEGLVLEGREVLPVFSERVQTISTRFGKSADLIMKAETICAKTGVKTIAEAERAITAGDIDCLVVSPCTGNTLAKIALGITDSTVTMAAKAQLRNRRPVLIALASNDALGGNLKNIASLIERKNVYFVPFGQDEAKKKPTSLVCDFKQLSKSIDCAVSGVQIQPVLTAK